MRIARARSAAYWLTAVLVVVSFASGFLNLVPLGDLRLATLVVDAVWVAMVAHLALYTAVARGRWEAPPWVVMYGVLVAVSLVLAVLSAEPLAVVASSWRSTVGYAVVAVYVFGLVRSRAEQRALVKLAVAAAVCSAAFGIVQFVVGGSLPTALLAPVTDSAFSYYGTDILRANGLVGNTIVYSTVLLLFVVIVAAKVATRFALLDALAAALLLVAVLCTFSRMSIAVAVAAIAAAVLLTASRRRPDQVLVASVVGVAVAAFVALTAWSAVGPRVQGSFIVQDLFLGGNESVQASDDAHGRDARRAAEIFGESPVFGHGFGTHSLGSSYGVEHDTITDGAILSRIAEGGLLLTLAYAAMAAVLVGSAVRFWQRDSTNYVAAGVAAFMTFEFAVASWINSGIFGKSPFILTAIMFGLAAATDRSTRTSPTDQTADISASLRVSPVDDAVRPTATQ